MSPDDWLEGAADSAAAEVWTVEEGAALLGQDHTSCTEEDVTRTILSQIKKQETKIQINIYYTTKRRTKLWLSGFFFKYFHFLLVRTGAIKEQEEKYPPERRCHHSWIPWMLVRLCEVIPTLWLTDAPSAAACPSPFLLLLLFLLCSTFLGISGLFFLRHGDLGKAMLFFIYPFHAFLVCPAKWKQQCEEKGATTKLFTGITQKGIFR